MASTISAGLTTTTALVYSADTSGVLQLQTNGTTTAVTIDTSQNVGIGTASPSYKLDVNGTANLRSTDTAVYIRWDNSKLLTMQTNESGSNATEGVKFTVNGRTQYGVINAYGGALRLVAADSGANGATIFSKYDGTTSTESMRIDTSGNLLIGATTTIDQSRLLVQLNSTSTAFSTNGFSGDVNYCPVRIIKYDNNSTTSNAFIRFIINNDGIGSGQINANGSNQAAFGSYSDITLKENIIPLGPQLANINKIEVIEFDYLASEGGGHQIGFSAQNMQGIYPDSVGERLDGKLTLTGWNKTEARLVKAIQELSAQVTALSAKVTALEAKVGA